MVSTTPLQGDTAAGRSWPSIGGEYYTPTLRSALWHAFQQHTRGTKPLPVRPNHRPALSRVRDPKPIPSPPGTTGGPGSSLSDVRSPWRERDLARKVGHGWPAIQGEKIRESNPARPMRSPRRNASSSSSCRAPSCPSQESIYASQLQCSCRSQSPGPPPGE